MESKEGKSEQDLTIAELLAPMAAIFKFDLTEEGVLDLYENALAKVEMDLLQVTVSAMMDDLDWMPRPSEILRTAKKIEAESSDKPAEPAHWRKSKYKCLDCRDTGWITVWHPRAQAAALAYLANHLPEDKFRRNQYEAAAKCRCQAGQDRPGDVATYNPDRHIKISVAGHGERVKALLAAVKNMKPSNHVPEFDEWAGT